MTKMREKEFVRLSRARLYLLLKRAVNRAQSNLTDAHLHNAELIPMWEQQVAARQTSIDQIFSVSEQLKYEEFLR